LELQKQQEGEEEKAALNLDTVFILFTKKFAFLVHLLLLPEFQNPNKKPRRSSKSVHVYPIWVEEEPKRRFLGLGLEEHMVMMRRRRRNNN
jgi:hypothetical protein